MSDDEDAAEFERMRERAKEAIDGDDVVSVYVGLVRAGDQNEFYFGNDVDEAELRKTAARQLGMMTRVLAEQSESSVEEISELAARQAEEIDLRP